MTLLLKTSLLLPLVLSPLWRLITLFMLVLSILRMKNKDKGVNQLVEIVNLRLRDRFSSQVFCFLAWLFYLGVRLREMFNLNMIQCNHIS